MTEEQRKLHPNVYKAFFLNDNLRKELKDTRKHNESLHDYLTRKGINCFCNACRSSLKESIKQKNKTLL
jgi:hypothetical protein